MSYINDARESHVVIPGSLDEMGLTLEAYRVYCHLARLMVEPNSARPNYSAIGETCFRGSYPDASAASLEAKAIAAMNELITRGLVREGGLY